MCCCSCFEGLAHKLQLLNLNHSWYNIFAWILKPITLLITFYQQTQTISEPYLDHKRNRFGKNFACAGGVWMCDMAEVKKNLVEPQARTFKIGGMDLRKSKCPKKFILALSQSDTGGNGDWEACRAVVNEVIFDEACKKRGEDEISKKLIDDFAKEYKVVLKSKRKMDKLFQSSDSGLKKFVAKYIHYVVLGLDPSNVEQMKAIEHLYFELDPTLYYVNIISQIETAGTRGAKYKKALLKVAKIYEESPAISALNEKEERYKGMTKVELSLLIVSMMTFAGMLAPRTIIPILLGYKRLPNYEGHDTSSIQVKKVWDSIDLNNRDEVLKYMYECGRLCHPVQNTHKIAQTSFTAEINGKNVKFPKGTMIYIPLQLANLDESIYGSNTYEFDHLRENLCPYSTLFHSIGNQTNGLLCPGKEVSEKLLVDLLIALGKVRHGLSEQGYDAKYDLHGSSNDAS